MKRNILVVLVVSLCTLLVPVAMADTFPLTVKVTADNWVAVWFLDGAGLNAMTLTGNADNWKVAKIGTANIYAGQNYDMIFQVINTDKDGGYRPPSAKNPGGFLGEIDFPTYSVLSSTDGWTYATRPNIVDPGSPGGYDPYVVSSFDGWTWQPVSGYGSNAGPNIWSRNGGVPEIDQNAEWIWTPQNYGDAGAPGVETSVFIRYQDDPLPVPEPSLILMLGIGLGAAGFAGHRRKK